MPGGIRTVTLRTAWVAPHPPHAAQGVSGIRLLPPHSLQGAEPGSTKPVEAPAPSVPLPPQRGHGWKAPVVLPVPPQVLQRIEYGTSITRSPPRTASSRLTSSRTRMSESGFGLNRPAGPHDFSEKKRSKASPKSEKSAGPGRAGESLHQAGDHRYPSWPRESYRERSSWFERTRYASLIRLNRSSAPGSPEMSGWNRLARAWYALLISRSGAFFGTPRIS